MINFLTEAEKKLYEENKEAVLKEIGSIDEDGYFRYLEDGFTKMSDEELLENYNIYNTNVIYLEHYNKFK